MDGPLNSTFGADFRYREGGYLLPGHIIERMSGFFYADFLEIYVLEPWMMTNA